MDNRVKSIEKQHAVHQSVSLTSCRNGKAELENLPLLSKPREFGTCTVL